MKKRASKTLKDLKAKRIAFNIGSGVGYGTGGGGSMEGTTVYGQPTLSGTSTDYSSYTNTNFGGNPAGNSGTPSYGAGGGNATGSSASANNREEEELINEIIVEGQPTQKGLTAAQQERMDAFNLRNKEIFESSEYRDLMARMENSKGQDVEAAAELKRIQAGMKKEQEAAINGKEEINEVVVEAEPILVKEGGIDEYGNWNAPVYESQGTMPSGYGGGSSSTPNTEESNENNEEEDDEMPESTDKDERDFPVEDGRKEQAEEMRVGNSGGSSTEGSTDYTSTGSKAPLDIDQTNPTYTAPTMEAAKVSGYGMLTEDKDIQTLDEAGTVVVDDVKAKRATAYGQAAPDKVETPDAVEGAEYTATKAEGVDVTAAQGEVSEEAQAKLDDAELTERAKAAERDKAAEEAAMADAVEYDISTGAYVNKVTGKVATVQETREAEAKTREAITGEPAPDGEAAQIMSMYEYNQLEKRTISKDKVVKNLKAQGLKDEEIAQRLADNPELVADEMDDMPEDIKTTLSGLPQEALMSAQMESLMAGMEDGEIPIWARPALAKVEANLAKRGMSSSSVGRDALFNAIIQSAMPIAQSNAQAIQNATSQDKQIAADFLSKNAGFQQQMNLANLSNDQQMRLANLTAQNQASSDNLNAAQQTELANLNTRMQTNLLQGKIAADMNQAQLTVDQQRAVQNASMVANVDMAKFNAAQQVELTNSKFMQTMVATEFNAEQQTAMQNATAMASMDMANLDKNTKLAVQNAQAFLQMDMTNLSNEQQANVMRAQNQQQAMLSTQAAENAAKQFGAASQQQADQFMANLSVQVDQYNASASAARDQFNATEKNRMEAINAGNDLQAQQFNEQLNADVQKFNEQQDFQRDQWNAANAQAVEQSNIQWRRQANLANTAAQNTANQQNAQIAYNLTSQEQTQLWQQLRDEAAYIRQNFENEQQRKAQLLATAIGNEKIAGKSSSSASDWLGTVIQSV